MKQKLIFYVLSLTWGLPLTLVGLVTAAVLMCFGYKPKKWGGCWYFEIGKNWGGVELGLIFLKDQTDSVHTKNHEFGHAIQNCVFGPFMIFIVAIPSAIRYWYRRLQHMRGITINTAYDDIWFEGSATRLGTKYIDKW